MSASAGGLLVVWVSIFNLTLIYFAWATSRVKRSMEAPPTQLITPSPLRHHRCLEIQRLGMVCICLQVLQLYFYSHLQNRPVALRCTWRWCVKPGVHRLESLCFHKLWYHDTGDSEHGGCLCMAVESKHFVIHQQNSVLCGKSLVHLLVDKYFSAPKQVELDEGRYEWGYRSWGGSSSKMYLRKLSLSI